MIFTDGMTASPIPISDIGSGFGGYIGAKAEDAAASWPIQRISDIVELRRVQGKAVPFMSRDINDITTPEERGDMLTLPQARDKLKSEGIDHRELHITNEGVAAPALDIMVARYKAKREREATIERGPNGILTGALGVGTSFAVGAVDPLNIASGFIPVVGQARYANMMAGAGVSALARAGVRTRVGALEGAVGQAMLEPIEAYATSQEGGDYTLTSALHSIMFGAALGSGLRTGGGAIADVVRMRRDRPLYPFNVGEPGSNHPAWEDLSTLKPYEPLAARPESPFLPGRTQALPDVMPAPEPIRVSPMVEALSDLPPRAKEDLTRVAIASLHDGQPVKVAEVLAASSSDPRIRESLDLVNRPEVRTSARRVGDDVSTQLTAAGMGESEARVNGVLMAARYAARAQRLGRDAHELYQADGVAVRRGGADVGQGRTFEQSRPTAPTFFSAVVRTVESAKLTKGSPDQWLATIKNTPGVKPEELEWLGLGDWLKDQKGAVTKEQVAEYVRANQIEVNEVTKGAAPKPDLVAVPHPGGRGWTLQHRGGDYLNIEGEGIPRWNNQQTAEAVMTRQETSDHYGGSDTKFAEYQLPGGDNYRELLLTLPAKSQFDVRATEGKYRLFDNKTNDWVKTPDGKVRTGYDSEAAAREAATGLNATAGSNPMGNFTSSHWDEPNVLAHVRFNDRTIDGKRTLFVEEIQSDWHQQGRTKGYKSGPEQLPEGVQLYRPDPDNYPNAWEWKRPGDDIPSPRFHAENEAEARAVAARNWASSSSAVPDAPFKTTWPELSLKRMIRYAAENGYDQIAWTPGHVQAERYDLSKQISRVVLHDNSSGGIGRPRMEGPFENGNVIAFDHNGREVINKRVTPQELPDIIGKEVADKLLNAEPKRSSNAGVGVRARELSGLDLKVGGEGMSGFYDKILPAAANKLVKKYGARVELKKIGELEQSGDIRQFGTEAEARAAVGPDGYVNERPGGTFIATDRNDNFLREGGSVSPLSVHTLPITPELRDAAVSQGFPLFQRSGDSEPRGRIELSENKAIITLFHSADKSTFLHEAGHLFLDQLARDAQLENVPQALKDDLGTVLRWLGVDRVEDVGVPQHEQWARGFEQYLASGEAPSNALVKAFQAFKEWLGAIYRSLRDLGEPLPDDIRGVMDRMLATDAEIAERRGPPKTKEQAWAELSRREPEEVQPVAAKAEHPASLQPQEIPEGLAREAPKAVEIPESEIVTTEVKAKVPRGRAAADPQTWSLFEFLASKGGLAPDQKAASGDLQAIIDKRNFVPGFGPLLRKDGITLDHARAMAVEAGYLSDISDQTGGQAKSSINQLLELIDAEARGQKQHRVGFDYAKGIDSDEQRFRIEQEINDFVVQAGVGEPSAAAHKRAVEIMQKEGIHDPDVALERAIMENAERDQQVADARREDTNDIPGWDRPVRDEGGTAPRAGAEDKGFPGGDRSAVAAGAGSRTGGEADRSAPERLTPVSASAKAAAKAEQLAKAEYDALVAAGDITPEDKIALDTALAAIDAEASMRARMVREGAGCLAGGFGFAAAAPAKAAGA